MRYGQFRDLTEPYGVTLRFLQDRLQFASITYRGVAIRDRAKMIDDRDDADTYIKGTCAMFNIYLCNRNP